MEAVQKGETAGPPRNCSPSVYLHELRNLAAVKMAAEAPGDTLNATAAGPPGLSCGLVGDQKFDGRGQLFRRRRGSDAANSRRNSPPQGCRASRRPGRLRVTLEESDRVGESLGLIEEIGEGGMGSVYMAQQTEPVKRAVAVKVIKAGMDSKAVLARFEAERQALALMDHPNIATGARRWLHRRRPAVIS